MNYKKFIVGAGMLCFMLSSCIRLTPVPIEVEADLADRGGVQGDDAALETDTILVTGTNLDLLVDPIVTLSKNGQAVEETLLFQVDSETFGFDFECYTYGEYTAQIRYTDPNTEESATLGELTFDVGMPTLMLVPPADTILYPSAMFGVDSALLTIEGARGMANLAWENPDSDSSWSQITSVPDFPEEDLYPVEIIGATDTELTFKPIFYPMGRSLYFIPATDCNPNPDLDVIEGSVYVKAIARVVDNEISLGTNEKLEVEVPTYSGCEFCLRDADLYINGAYAGRGTSLITPDLVKISWNVSQYDAGEYSMRIVLVDLETNDEAPTEILGGNTTLSITP